jgi:acetate kinase
MRILVLNGGSSTFKCWYGELSDPIPVEAQRPQWQKKLEWQGAAEQGAAKSALETGLRALSLPVDAIGHRIVHGGRALRQSTIITPEVRETIAQQAELAPSHNRLELEAISTAEAVFGAAMPQVAVFDTAFHATLPPAAYVYPGPYEWRRRGIRRFGFHGISHHYASQRTADLLGRELSSLQMVTCHLGNGCSLAAICEGRSIETTMGFTPLEGLMMGTRSGSIDPGIMIYLIRHSGYTADQLDRILNQESGLCGISGLSGDMREILAAAGQGNERARLAFDIYAHRLCLGIGSMIAALGGLDALVFTAGIGENCPPLRERVAAQFAFLGMKLNAAKNAAPVLDQDIAAEDSKVRVVVLRAEEDWEIARECYRVLKASSDAA